ncbi:acylphosphatase [Virgibacillus sp. NKC19-16]|uniref:acylphosphatase n=1 Tax=Virgibacillus salidurans TaxID=2831673 RepID=UPI001F210C9A|nr:acylphosphatase [Virgibacillus sp. NKC19-16]UJL45904.1 acylphosphatase [Virgibacillus sp. NKC19-16]
MAMKEDKMWLPHLEGTIPQEARGYTLSMYTIALEAWRRGIKVRFFNNTHKKSQMRYSLSFQDKEHFFTVSRGDFVPREAVKICINKQLTKEYLEKADVPTPVGDEFGEETDDEKIIAYAKSLGYPLVIKPSNGTGGHGVIADIKDEAAFRNALTYVRKDLKYTDVIVERFSVGVDHRVFVIGGQVIGAFRRIPANVVGDGNNSIRHLLRVKNKERDKNPSLGGLPITIDKEVHNTLAQRGYNLDSIPAEGERVFLKTKNNVSSGGDSTDATDELSEEIKNIAVRTSEAIPGLVQCGIDMVIDRERNTGEILEINSRPAIRNHLYPMVGKARDIPKAIVDYYFPETEKINSPVDYYFDFDMVAENFRKRTAQEFLIPPMPTGNIAAKSFLISGKLYNTNYDQWVQKQARKLKLDGYIKHLESNNASLVISGNVESIDQIEHIIREKTPKRFKVTNITEKNWEEPIKQGFDIKRPPKQKKRNVNTYKKEYEDLQKDFQKLKKERDHYKKEIKEIEKSSSWKLTKPIRIAGRIVKK